MEIGSFDTLQPEDRQQIAVALAMINLTDVLGKMVEVQREGTLTADERTRRIEAIAREAGQHSLRAPDGFWFAITAKDETFEVSDYIPFEGAQPEDWSANHTRVFEKDEAGAPHTFLASEILIQQTYFVQNPGAAFAYSPDGQSRCMLRGDSMDAYRVELVPIDDLPELVVNPQEVPGAPVAA